MRYVPLQRAHEGMILSKCIYDGQGRILLGSNSVITAQYIEKLQQRGLSGIYIEDELAKDIEIEELITPQLRNDAIDALHRGDIDASLSVAKKMVEDILSAPYVRLDMIDLRTFDDYTYSHSVNVAVLSTIIGIQMGLDMKSIEELCISAILHDIGKSSVGNEIINKPAKLTTEEYETIKKHPVYAYDMLKQRIDISACIKAGILGHHENEDGSGYPSGLKGDQIYIYAKIIHAADVFDALTAERPYKKPFERAEAMEYMMGSCGRQFDLNVVSAFLKSVPIYAKGTSVFLSDGREAVVVDNSKNSLRPIVRFLDGVQMDLRNDADSRSLTIVSHKKADLINSAL